MISGEKSLTMDGGHRRQLLNVSQPLYNRRNELRSQLISLGIISVRYTIRTRFLCHSSNEEFGTCFYLFTFLFVYRWRSFEFPVTIKKFGVSSYFLLAISSSVEDESKGCQCCRIFANSIVYHNQEIFVFFHIFHSRGREMGRETFEVEKTSYNITTNLHSGQGRFQYLLERKDKSSVYR